MKTFYEIIVKLEAGLSHHQTRLIEKTLHLSDRNNLIWPLKGKVDKISSDSTV